MTQFRYDTAKRLGRLYRWRCLHCRDVGEWRLDLDIAKNESEHHACQRTPNI